MPEFAREAALAVVELAVGHDPDGHSAAQVEVEQVFVVLGFAARVLRIAAGPRVVFEQHADADAVFEQVAQRLFARGEVFVAAARVGVHAPRDADPQPEDFTPVDTAGGDEAFDVGADFLETLRAVEQLERGVELLLDDVILQVGNQVGHVVAPDIDPCEIDGRIGQSEDVGTPSARGFDLAQVADDSFVNKFLHEFGDRGYADVQLPGQLREGTLAVERHVGDDIALDEAVFVRNALEYFVLVSVEKFG